MVAPEDRAIVVVVVVVTVVSSRACFGSFVVSVSVLCVGEVTTKKEGDGSRGTVDRRTSRSWRRKNQKILFPRCSRHANKGQNI